MPEFFICVHLCPSAVLFNRPNHNSTRRKCRFTVKTMKDERPRLHPRRRITRQQVLLLVVVFSIPVIMIVTFFLTHDRPSEKPPPDFTPPFLVK